MVLYNRIPDISPSDYLALEIRSEERIEYYHGEIFAMANGTPEHSQITLNLDSALNQPLKDRDCIVFGSDLKVHITRAKAVVFPDSSVICGAVERSKGKKILFETLC